MLYSRRFLHIFIYCVLILAEDFAEGKVSYHVIALFDSITFEGCECERVQQHIWKYEGVELFRNDMRTNDRFEENAFILNNFSLFLQDVTFEHAGMYECSCGTNIKNKHFIQIKGKGFFLKSFNDIFQCLRLKLKTA